MTNISAKEKVAEFELDPLLRAQAAQIKAAIEFWRTKKGAKLAPTRAQFNLRETLGFAPHMQILEVLDKGKAYRQRLTGTAIVNQLKEDPTGRVYANSSTDPVVQRMLRALGWVFQNKKPLRAVAHRTILPQQEFLKHESVILPLSSDDVDLDMMLTVSVFTPCGERE